MENSQLIAVLRTFTSKEIREFKKWLASPFHNQRKDVVLLFDYLFKNDHLERPRKITKEKIFQKIFPGENFDDARIRQTMHFLYKQVEDYLSFVEMFSDKTRKNIVLTYIYRKRNLNKSVEREIEKIQKHQAKAPIRDSNFLYNDYLLQEEMYNYRALNKRTVKFNLQEYSDALDKSYVANKLKQTCQMLDHKRIYKAEYTDGLLTSVIDYVERENLLDIPAIAIYYQIYKTYTNPVDGVQHFSRLKKSIVDYGHSFPKTEAKDMLLMAINFCISKQNQGYFEFVKESFELYNYGIDHQILIEDNMISKYTFINVMRACTMLNEFDWGERFLEKYSGLILDKDKDSIIHFCRGKLLFQKESYDESMSEFAQVKETDILLNLSSKHSLLKIYYKQDYHEVLLSLSDSMLKYIKRKDIPVNYRKVYESIVLMMKKLVRVNPYNKSDIQKLRVEIEKTPTLPYHERVWMLEQVDTL